ncbi:hypothetical protein KP509_22G067600 [Ceratopteris richardii]|uniref:Uncharacterized protein n=1 Tax=Ceratopteris richardii TaxID=49495 RepID=A0A8T2S637_CERRI|nr:hypothetical protein KP509_22G067600 [Ceratopteris richardii]
MAASKCSQLMLLTTVLAIMVMSVMAGAPAEKHAAGGKSGLRRGFQPIKDLVTSSSLAEQVEKVDGKDSIFRVSKLKCPCSHQYCDGNRWKYCSCNVRVCSCSCHN